MRYTVHFTGVDPWLEPCPFQVTKSGEMSTCHRCVEISDEVVEKWKRSARSYHKCVREMRELAKAQRPHQVGVLEATADVYKESVKA